MGGAFTIIIMGKKSRRDDATDDLDRQHGGGKQFQDDAAAAAAAAAVVAASQVPLVLQETTQQQRTRSDAEEEDNGDSDVDFEETKESESDQSDDSSNDANNSNMHSFGFQQKRQLRRQMAAEKRHARQKCFLCGKTGHIRRLCPGIPDDGRGESKYKGKSSKKKKKAGYSNHSKSGSSAVTAPLEPDLNDLPEGFEPVQIQHSKKPENEDSALYFYDTSCDILATIQYLRTGRGKTIKLSNTEAVQEYQQAIQKARQTSNYGGCISRTTLKPNRPWSHPCPFLLADRNDNGNKEEKYDPIWFVLGLNRDFLYNEADLDHAMITTQKLLIDTLSQHPTAIVGFYCDFNLNDEYCAQPGCDVQSQKLGHRGFP